LTIDACAQVLAQSHFLKERGSFPPRVKDPTDTARFFFQVSTAVSTLGVWGGGAPCWAPR
jgi:hypothetical protein